MQRNRIIGAGLVVCLLAASLSFAAEQPGSQIEQIRRGWQVFNEKLCISCHAVWGEGARVGPDLGRIKTQFLSAGQLAGVMWNHAPDMWSRMISKGIPVHSITKEEMESLFLFLYFARFMDEPGDPVQGASLIYRKKCVICHATEPGESSVGPNFHSMGAQVNAMVWAEKMWNHAPRMYEEMRARGFPWPTFEGREMADLIAHVQSLAGSLERTYLFPGDRERGRKAFEDAGCASCHEGRIDADAPQLDYMARNPRTISEMAGLMWNHAPAMVRATKTAGVKWPRMTAQQTVDLIAYFFSLRFYREKGDVAKGKQLFSEKHCNACHSGSGGARDLRGKAEPTSAIQMARFMWQHGLEMLQKMEEMRVSWPTFEKDEFVDLLAYLNSNVEPAAGRPDRK
jgi:cytochrome c2